MIEIFRKASLCRNFENETYKQIQQKNITFPTYLSAGQEYIASSLSHYLEKHNPHIFIQHRGHSTYLAFGGKVEDLIDELLGKKTGCAHGMGGSASIQCKDKNIYGHDGLMGSQVPIAVGYAYARKKPTIVFVGDSAAEEDYVLSALGWAATKNLPILFVVEDNNLSILTEKKVRRVWEMDDVARGLGVESYNIEDNPSEINKCLKNVFEKPLLLNIRTIRKYWHAGAGTDGDYFDRYKEQMDLLGDDAKEIHNKTKIWVQNKWLHQLEIL